MNTKAGTVAQNGRPTAQKIGETLFIIGDNNKVIVQMPWLVAVRLINRAADTRLVLVLADKKGGI